MDPFERRVAVITGGAGGIGMALAEAFAARGAKIVLADIDVERLQKCEQHLSRQGAAVLGVPTDVTHRESVESLAQQTLEHFGGCHILCNNAGIAVLGPLAKATESDWQLTMGINFFGVVYGVEAFVPHMLAAGEGGHIVNTASMAGLTGMKGFGLYCASKFAVVGYTESLERELRDAGIGVSVLCPMIVQTDIAANTEKTLQRDATGPSGAAAPPAAEMQGGVIAPEEVAERVVAAIECRELYVLTHAAQKDILQRRGERLVAAAPES
ncbi:MAG: SDR family NAD(P)-dependent oxidoreductase [Proteobacteria bacterium]|nr:SDR family NAD(P)-dependent oxidoreductase [Pseudomonadota bacterium]